MEGEGGLDLDICPGAAEFLVTSLYVGCMLASTGVVNAAFFRHLVVDKGRGRAIG